MYPLKEEYYAPKWPLKANARKTYGGGVEGAAAGLGVGLGREKKSIRFPNLHVGDLT